MFIEVLFILLWKILKSLLDFLWNEFLSFSLSSIFSIFIAFALLLFSLFISSVFSSSIRKILFLLFDEFCLSVLFFGIYFKKRRSLLVDINELHSFLSSSDNIELSESDSSDSSLFLLLKRPFNIFILMVFSFFDVDCFLFNIILFVIIDFLLIETGFIL